MTHELTKIAVGEVLEWSDEAQNAFEKTKQAVIDCTITKGFFSDNDITVLWTDASPDALGAVLTQIDDKGADRIISFASKSLTKTEKIYPQTQREALGIVWAVEHFHYHLRGRDFTIKTDAKGIAFIFDREKDTNKRFLTRAEGFALRLSEYRYKVEHVAGEKNIADAPSRLYEGTPIPYVEREGPWEIGTLNGDPSELKFDENILALVELKISAKTDLVLLQVMDHLAKNEWPRELTKDIMSFRAVKEELYLHDGVLLKAGAVVVPKDLRLKALKVAHLGHPGATAMKSILRARVWWPGMNRDVEMYVASCMSCLLVSRQNPPVPMSRTPLPTTVWENIAIDYNGPYKILGGDLLLVIGDVYSRYLFVVRVKKTDFESLFKALEEIFRLNGFPKAIKSDNGPPFSGQQYALYLAQRDIKKVHSSPYWPQQNGLAERYMQVVNKAMQIAELEGTNSDEMLRQTIRAHNSAKHRITNISPEELMLNRKVRRHLPLVGSALTNHDNALISQKDTAEKATAKEREDMKRGAKGTKIEVGDSVVIKRIVRAKGESRFDPKKWKVVDKFRGDLDLESDDGKTTKRNVTLVKKVIFPPYHRFQDPDIVVNDDLEMAQEEVDSDTIVIPELAQKELSIDMSKNSSSLEEKISGKVTEERHNTPRQKRIRKVVDHYMA